MTTLLEPLRVVIAELERVQPDGVLDATQLDREQLPTFRTAESGEERYFSNAALSALSSISRNFYENDTSLRSILLPDAYDDLVIQAATDCHAVGALKQKDACDKTPLTALRARVEESVLAVRTSFTHYFPAWTLGAEALGTFAVGPVVFRTREQWIDAVDFASLTKSTCTPDWKAVLRSRLREADGKPASAIDLAQMIFPAVSTCPSVLEVTVDGSELHLSYQRARFACRTALDSLALLIQGGEFHAQFLLSDERTAPVSRSRLTAANGELWLPSRSFHPRGWDRDPTQVQPLVAHSQPVIDACGAIIGALLKPASHAAPELAKRWATALSWFGDGCRESQDSVAVAKLASCLDILSNGREGAGILQLLRHLTGWDEDHIVVPARNLSLKQVVRKIYSDGRSQIIHGNHIDPMKPFDDERRYATSLGRLALIETVLRWTRFCGADEPNAFRSIPK